MTYPSGTLAFENVKNQIGVCGIWCGSCIIGNGTLAKLSEKYERLLNAYGVQDWGPREIDFGQFEQALESLRALPACPGCRQGGGRDDCELRACAGRKGVSECYACDEYLECEHAELLARMRTGAQAAGLFVRLDSSDTADLVARWTARLEQCWPCGILFRD